jgi:hypothetical protein
MVPIRVLRLIEYVYDTPERAEADRQHWQIPPIGTRRHGDMVIRSTILEDLDWKGPTSINYPPTEHG